MASGESFELRKPDEEGNWLTGKKFQCYWKKFERPGISSLLQWKILEKNESNIPTDEMILNKYLPVRTVDRHKLSNPPADKIQVTWIGHATVLVQFDGITILTDPLFRNFCGPEPAKHIPQMGYRRYREAACTAANIPQLDAVLISHNHFDHLDRGSVEEICKSHKRVKWYVPLGLKAWLLGRFEISEDNIHELTWMDEHKLSHKESEITFTCVPSQHWCQRGPLDLNKVLWCSWVVKSKKHSFYFGGDTGYYGPLFKKIGETFGPFSLAAIPIGAYNPRHITSYQHVEPEESVDIHRDIKSSQSIGIHWGTFELTNEFFLEPPNKVASLMGDKASEFISLCLGETWVVGDTSRQASPFMGISCVEDMK